MTQFDPPLTEIKTPHKDHENEFKYPPPPSTKVQFLSKPTLMFILSFCKRKDPIVCTLELCSMIFAQNNIQLESTRRP